MRVHENEFISVTRIRTIRINSKNEFAFAIIDGEAITGEEERSFHDSEMGGGCGGGPNKSLAGKQRVINGRNLHWSEICGEWRWREMKEILSFYKQRWKVSEWRRRRGRIWGQRLKGRHVTAEKEEKNEDQ